MCGMLEDVRKMMKKQNGENVNKKKNTIKDSKACHVPGDITFRTKGTIPNLVLVCLWSNPKITAVGCTPNAIDAIAGYVGISLDEAKKTILALDKIEQVVFDTDTGEALTPNWLEYNYLQENSVAENPQHVMKALGDVQSSQLRGLLLKEISRLDVVFDAGIDSN